MTITSTYCKNCNHENTDKPNFCPECGTEKPWKEKPVYDMNDVDFPVILQIEHYNDSHELWRSFCLQEFGTPNLKGNDIANMPENFPDMKYNVTQYYLVIHKNDIKGPFLKKSEAQKTIH